MKLFWLSATAFIVFGIVGLLGAGSIMEAVNPYHSDMETWYLVALIVHAPIFAILGGAAPLIYVRARAGAMPPWNLTVIGTVPVVTWICVAISAAMNYQHDPFSARQIKGWPMPVTLLPMLAWVLWLAVRRHGKPAPGAD